MVRTVAIVALIAVVAVHAKNRAFDVQDLSATDGDMPTLGEELGTGADTTIATLLTAKVAEEVITATAAGAASTGTCGDGKREGNEECDDGNTAANDGCNPVCKVEGGYQCLPLEVGGKDVCQACADTQCTTFFGGQSRCLNTAATMQPTATVSTTPRRVGAKPEEVLSLSLLTSSFLQTEVGGQGSYKRGPLGFCECAPNWCKLAEGPDSFTCKSTAKGWARKSFTDNSCTCAPGFCSMPLAGTTPTQYHCTAVHANMIRNNNTGICECRGAVVPVVSSDPAKAVKAQTAACQILPTKPVLAVAGGADKFGKFECVGAPYEKDPASVKCKQCAATSCTMSRSIGTGNFLCFSVSNGTFAKSAPYSRKPDGKCECGKDQCLKPNGDHYVCRDLNNAKPYGPTKHSDGMCGCSADKNVCKLKLSTGYRCVHVTQDNFARNYRRANNGDCECKSDMCIGKPHKDNGALQCKAAMADAPYMRKPGTFECTCKPGACKFPNGVCKVCPVVPGHCESHCHNSTATDIECVKFCRTSNIDRKMVRATAQGQLQSVKKMVAREIGCFVQKVTKCSITASAKKCTQTKSAKALYDCPAAKSGSVPLRLHDGTETYGFGSICARNDLECQIQKCGRNPDSNKCVEQAMLA
jgi:cysteine-rich repeat protein